MRNQRPDAQGIVTGQRVNPVKLDRAKELRRTQTPDEEMLWQRLRRSQLRGFHFRRQQVIQGFIVDFYCHRARLVVEIDGAVHERQRDYDDDRDVVLAQLGLRILRFSSDAVRRDLDGIVTAIALALEDRSS